MTSRHEYLVAEVGAQKCRLV